MGDIHPFPWNGARLTAEIGIDHFNNSLGQRMGRLIAISKPFHVGDDVFFGGSGQAHFFQKKRRIAECNGGFAEKSVKKEMVNGIHTYKRVGCRWLECIPRRMPGEFFIGIRLGLFNDDGSFFANLDAAFAAQAFFAIGHNRLAVFHLAWWHRKT